MGIPFKSTNHKQLATRLLEIRAYGTEGGHRVQTDHNLRIAYHPNDMMFCSTYTQDSKAGQFWCFFQNCAARLKMKISTTRHWSSMPICEYHFPRRGSCQYRKKWMVFELVYMFAELLEGKWRCAHQETRWQVDWNTGNTNCHNTRTQQGKPEEDKLGNEKHWLISEHNMLLCHVSHIEQIFTNKIQGRGVAETHIIGLSFVEWGMCCLRTWGGWVEANTHVSLTIWACLKTPTTPVCCSLNACYAFPMKTEQVSGQNIRILKH